jgi:transposase
MTKRYRVTLTPAERQQLEQLVERGRLKKGLVAARTLTHARILLKADAGETGPAWTDAAICAALEVGLSTVARVRQRFVEEGLEAALQRRPQVRPSRPRKLDGVQEAYLLALACSPPPAGQARWTLRLLADQYVQLQYVDYVCHETVRQVLKKVTSSLG